jgi:hypothetical protein
MVGGRLLSPGILKLAVQNPAVGNHVSGVRTVAVHVHRGGITIQAGRDVYIWGAVIAGNCFSQPCTASVPTVEFGPQENDAELVRGRPSRSGFDVRMGLTVVDRWQKATTGRRFGRISKTIGLTPLVDHL